MELLQPYGKYILIGLVAITLSRSLRIAGIALVVWISIVAIVMRNTQGIPSAINDFFRLISEDNLKEAYNFTTDNFQNRISQPQFKKLVKNYKFKQY